MRGLISASFLVVCCAAHALAQQDPSANTAAAKAALDQKQRQREAARAQPITMTVGELDDLRQENRRLRAEVEAMRQKLAVFVQPGQRRFREIELGMTKPELVAFLRQRWDEYRVGRFIAEAGGMVADRSEAIVHRQVSDDTIGYTPRATTQQAVQSVENRRLLAKREKVTIDVLGYVPGVVGQENNWAGSSAVIGSVKACVGRIYVELTDDVVTMVRVNDYDAGY
jgi:hypothetical protein